jgi:hypothetical protein
MAETNAAMTINWREAQKSGVLTIISLSAPMGRRGERAEIKINIPRLLPRLPGSAHLILTLP